MHTPSESYLFNDMSKKSVPKREQICESRNRSTVNPRKYMKLSGLALSLFLATSVSSTVLAQQFQNVTASTGLIQEAKKSWGDPIWGDMNNDGYLDLIVPCHGLSSSGGPFVYLNNGGNSFTDIRATCGIMRASELDDGDWHGFAFGDYDQDGNLDVYITEGAKGNRGGTIKRDLLYKGHGDGTFSYVSSTAGIVTDMNRGRGPFFVDYDNDGRIDLFVKNYGGTNNLYRGNTDGTLSLVAGGAGLDLATHDRDDGSIDSFVDYDNDGFMDVIITGDANSQALYRNQGGTFVDATSAANMVPQNNGKGVAWGDYNNDGFMDLFIARGKQGKLVQGTSLYRNNGDGTFTDVTNEAGVLILKTCWNGSWGDYDNDGLLDLYVTDSGDTGMGVGNNNFLFHNNGDGTFTDVAAANGVDMADGTSLHKGVAWADYNNDGFLDLLIKDGVASGEQSGQGAFGLHILFKNLGNSNHFIKLNLKGVQSNLHGIGARVKVVTTNGTVYGQNNGGGGGNNDSQSCEPMHFGLGAATTANVVVNWPSGIVDTLTNVAANSTITLTENSSNQTAPPEITRQPRNRQVLVGETASFAVAATGDALQYQWRKNGNAIPGANGSTYTTPPATLDDNGSLFSVVVSNPGGSVTSRNAALGVTQ
jgi:hypothetical protein